MKKQAINCSLTLLLAVVLIISPTLAASTHISVDICLTESSVCTLQDGSIVMGGYDPYSTLYDKSRSAWMLCIATAENEYNQPWKYEANNGNDTYGFFQGLQALPDDSVCALLTMLENDPIQQKVSIIRVKNGKKVSERPVADGTTNFMYTPDGLLLFAYDIATQNSDLSTLSFYDNANRLRWEKHFRQNTTVSKILTAGDGYYIIGSRTAERVTARYIAKLNMDGELLWERAEKVENGSMFNDVAFTKEGNLVAVGGNYESADASEFAKAVIACYTPSGSLKWQDELCFDELSFHWSSVACMDESIVAVGSNNLESATVSAAHYDLNGHKLFYWDEPVSNEIDRSTYIQLIPAGTDNVYLIVTGDTGWWFTRKPIKPGELRYKTVLEKLEYKSPL